MICLRKGMSLNKYLSIALGPLLAAVWALSLGTANVAVCADSKNEDPSHAVTVGPNRVILAESGTGENKKNGKTSEPDESGPKTDPKKNESSSRSKSKPSKRFVPSEKIRAEQGVDFPYDI
jgi:hypothetical protein